MSVPSTPDDILSVSQLTFRIKETLEMEFPMVCVAGEISNLSRPQSGHIYLTLKDEHAQIRAAIWRTTASQLRFDVKDGLEVICQGDIDVYPPRGSYQLIIRQVVPLGVGPLQLALQQLHTKLAAEGLFEPRHKKPLPAYPRRVAFVTSPTGAAIHDFLEVARRRWTGIHVLVIPARVQGEEAAAEIADGIRLANELSEPPDVLVVGRGGGSLEDLWCFNEEEVVRAIFASRIPVVSAVGHEVDVTLSDLVADLRALTPTEAAERIAPSGDELLATLRSHGQRLTSGLRSRAAMARSQLEAIAARRPIRRPFDLIHDLARRIDDCQLRAARGIQHCITQNDDQIRAFASRLESLSPLNVLSRGYSLTERTRDGQLVVDASTLSIGDQLTTRLGRGSMISRIEEIDDGEE